MTAAGAQSLTITSQISPPPTAPLPPQQEDGVELVAGRLFVGNVFGSFLEGALRNPGAADGQQDAAKQGP